MAYSLSSLCENSLCAREEQPSNPQTGVLAVESGYRWYDSVLGRWWSRDPIGESGGVNLYGFVRNNAIGLFDLLGHSWRVIREGKEYAIAEACIDTVDNLAGELNLSENEYRDWMKPEDGYRLPLSSDDPIEYGLYRIPNTVFLDVGKKRFLDGVEWHPLNVLTILRILARENASYWRAEKFKVVETVHPTHEQVFQHLRDPNIYVYIYVGHGARGASINVVPKSEEVSAGDYTKYGIAAMYLYACASAEPFERAKPSEIWDNNIWEYNVSYRGIFYGYSREVYPWDCSEYTVIVPGKRR